MQAKQTFEGGPERWAVSTDSPSRPPARAATTLAAVGATAQPMRLTPPPSVARAPVTPQGLRAALESDGWQRVHRLRQLRLMGARWTMAKQMGTETISVSCRRVANRLTLIISSSAVERGLRDWLASNGLASCAIVVESPDDRFPWFSLAVAASAIALFCWIVLSKI